MAPSLTRYDLPSPKMEILDVPQDQLPDACCHLTIYMIEDTDKLSAVPNIIMS